MKHYYIQQKYVSFRYTIDIGGPPAAFDQRRVNYRLEPGYQTSIKVIPQVMETSARFRNLDLDVRKCKLASETEGFKLYKKYSILGCQVECAVKQATDICRCLPWFYPNSEYEYPICDWFGMHCFDLIMTNETSYKMCPEWCLKNCEGTVYSYTSR